VERVEAARLLLLALEQAVQLLPAPAALDRGRQRSVVQWPRPPPMGCRRRRRSISTKAALSAGAVIAGTVGILV
jgi:hypothetical protein